MISRSLSWKLNVCSRQVKGDGWLSDLAPLLHRKCLMMLNDHVEDDTDADDDADDADDDDDATQSRTQV